MNTEDRDDRLDHEGLSDAERAAIEEQDDQGNDTKPPAADAGAPPAASPAAEADDEDQDDERTELREAARDLREAAAAMRAKEQAVEQPPAEPAPAPRDYDAEMAALEEKYENGEIENREFQRAFGEIVRARTLDEARQERQAEVAKQQQEAFARAYGEFFTGAEAEVNQRLQTKALKGGFDDIVVQLVAQGTSHMDALREARRQVFEQVGLSLPGAADEKAAKEDAVAKRASRDRPAPGLGDVPAAGALSTNVDSELDSLDVVELEKRLARMSPDKVEAYLASADGGLRDNPRGRDD
jgi:hypothetical protein